MIKSKQENRVTIITIDRPEKANSLPLEAKKALAREIIAANESNATGAIVLTGSGDRSFCAGTDIKEMSQFSPQEMYRMLLVEREMYLAVLKSQKPVVVAVNGFALGAGFNLVMVSDYAVSSSTAEYGSPELSIGVTNPLEGFLLPWIVGLGRARSMYYLGERMNAQEAIRLGLIHQIVNREECIARAIDVANRIGELPGDSFPLQKQLLYRLVMGGSLEEVILTSLYATSLQFANPDTVREMGRFSNK